MKKGYNFYRNSKTALFKRDPVSTFKTQVYTVATYFNSEKGRKSQISETAIGTAWSKVT